MAFELPLAYIYSDKFNQPIFGANNLSGELQHSPCMRIIFDGTIIAGAPS